MASEHYLCPECEGSGRCATCGGDGEVMEAEGDEIYQCEECDGSGYCGTCRLHDEALERQKLKAP